MKIKLTDRNWAEIQKRHDEGVNFPTLVKEFHINHGTLRKAVVLDLLRKHKVKSSKETKEKISQKRKQFLRDNPDKCHWRSADKFKSKPCEKVKEFLRSLNVSFVEEYQPNIEGRFFSLDIALPDKMIALEINGGQHYLPDGNLKPYYQKRHDLLVAHGWNVFEIHYSACYNFSKWSEFGETIRNGLVLKPFDYFTYTPREKRVYWKNLCSCGTLKATKAKTCLKCYKHSRITNKISWPTDETLLTLVWLKPLTALGKELGVTGNSIKKRCRKHSIHLPPMGHWNIPRN